MSSERKIFFRGIGEVVIRKRRNTRRLSIRVNRNGEVSMSIPFLVSYRDAERFLEQRNEWIKKTQARLQLSVGPKMIYGEGEIMSTRYHRINVERNVNPRPFFRIGRDETVISIHHECDITLEHIQDFIRQAVTETIRAEAKAHLVPRVEALAEQHRFKYKRVTVKNLTSRWGSCSSANNINLNIHLIRLPSHLADYVIIHELVHTVHRNHSSAFWEELGKHVREPRVLAKELRKYQTGIG